MYTYQYRVLGKGIGRVDPREKHTVRVPALPYDAVVHGPHQPCLSGKTIEATPTR
jgi:hypothetical protein